MESLKHPCWCHRPTEAFRFYQIVCLMFWLWRLSYWVTECLCGCLSLSLSLKRSKFTQPLQTIKLGPWQSYAHYLSLCRDVLFTKFRQISDVMSTHEHNMSVAFFCWTLFFSRPFIHSYQLQESWLVCVCVRACIRACLCVLDRTVT